MSQTFEEVLVENRKLVWSEIQKYLTCPLQASGKITVPRKYSCLTDFHQKLIRTYPERLGKYLRPTLVLLTAGAMGAPEKEVVKTAAAMQVSEDWLLVHDDFEDDSLERRGKPALHRIYGRELAVNAGDALHVIMWGILWDNRKVVGERRAAKIADEFCQMLDRTIMGQTVEIKWTRENKQDLTDEDVYFILDGKTSYYTIAGPMRLGAILGNASSRQLEAIYEFGQPLGRCFQVVDDLLDLTSDFKGLKKQTGNDIYEGKRTIMLMHLFRSAKGADKKELIKIMAKNRETKTAGEVKWVIELMVKYGSLEHGQKVASKLAKQARTVFEEKLVFLSHQPASDQLKQAIDFILNRKY